MMAMDVKSTLCTFSFGAIVNVHVIKWRTKMQKSLSSN